ncbi:MAG: outer membrane lipoprotein carrier protein LolA, partial [Verrucomicrobiota bacterium]
MMKSVSAILLLSVFLIPSIRSQDAVGIVERWLASNTGVERLKVDFRQKRTLKSLKVPIEQAGTLWMEYETGRFRWQLGTPPKTIVVKKGDEITIMRTPLKRVEVRPAASTGGDSGGMAMLGSGFPRSLSEFQKSYQILGMDQNGGFYRIMTRPLGSGAEGVESTAFIISADKFTLRGMNLRLKDGSEVATTFDRVTKNH